jgi:hypothetical protein
LAEKLAKGLYSMQQGYSGSTLRLHNGLVEKITSDEGFMADPERQVDLVSLSRELDVLPRIERIHGRSIWMEYIAGQEGLEQHNARRAGIALRRLHERRDYQHDCFTGVDWLVLLASENLMRAGLAFSGLAGFEAEYPADALIHSEPQFIEKENGSIVFIDIEGIGRGSRYQDLGFLYMRGLLDGKQALFETVMYGYGWPLSPQNQASICRMAGLVLLAYAAFADFDLRMDLGMRLLQGYLT